MKKLLSVVTLLIIIGAGMTSLVYAQYPNPNTNENRMEYEGKSSGVAIAYLNKYDQTQGRIIKEPIKEFTKEEANQIKDELLGIEKTYYHSTGEKISEQMKVLHKWELLPSDITFDEFVKLTEKIGSKYNSLPFDFGNIIPLPNVILVGPSITSFLVLGGIAYPLHLFVPVLTPWFMNKSIDTDTLHELLNGTRFEGWVGAMPVFVPISLTSAFISTIGLYLGPQTVFSPFIAFLVISFGVSINMVILEDIYPVNVFDFMLNSCALGAIVYIT